MFTTKNLDRVLAEMRNHNKKSPFCPKKHLVAYRLSRMSRNYRGVAIERMVRDYYKKIGKTVFHVGGNSSYDMIVNGHKIEVKSALAKMTVVGGVVKYSYKFGHIRPANFSKLVLVFISPEGISARVMNSNTVAKYTGSKNKHKDLFVGKKILGKVLAA